MTRPLIIGSRGSRLAMVQTESVAARLRQLSPGSELSITEVTTSGDRDRQTRLDRLPGIGVFVKELEEALLDGRIDLAVHSLKDVPTDLPGGLTLLAVLKRENPADVLVASATLDDLPSGARIGTGSLRRAAQLRKRRPDIVVCSIRGNVDTRLRKAADGEVDGVVLAAAAMIRLGWEDRITQYLPTDHFVPAVGQGALTIEARAEDDEAARIASPLNDDLTWRHVAAERAFLNALGGGCRAPIAALATGTDGRLHLSGMVANPDGDRIIQSEATGDLNQPEELGRLLARKMTGLGAAELISEVTPK